MQRAGNRRKSRVDEDFLESQGVPDETENDSVAELGLVDPAQIRYSQKRRRQASEPPRHFATLKTQKMFREADMLLLEDRSESRMRSFKIFEDKRVFPELYTKKEFKPLDKEEKHDVSYLIIFSASVLFYLIFA